METMLILISLLPGPILHIPMPDRATCDQAVVEAKDQINAGAYCVTTYPKPITTPRPQQKSLDYGPLAQERGAQEAFRSGLQALQEGRTNQAVKLLERAAEQGVPRAIWKLAGMYADGDGVKMDKGRADDYCLGLIDFASRYRNPGEAQYYLGLLYLEGKGAPKNAKTAAHWLALSANNKDHHAQVLLGHMLFKGDQVARQAARGLFWLTVAKEAAGPDEGWIAKMHASFVAQATDNDKALAHEYLMDWLNPVGSDVQPPVIKPPTPSTSPTGCAACLGEGAGRQRERRGGTSAEQTSIHRALKPFGHNRRGRTFAGPASRRGPGRRASPNVSPVGALSLKATRAMPPVLSQWRARLCLWVSSACAGCRFRMPPCHVAGRPGKRTGGLPKGGGCFPAVEAARNVFAHGVFFHCCAPWRSQVNVTQQKNESAHEHPSTMLRL